MAVVVSLRIIVVGIVLLVCAVVALVGGIPLLVSAPRDEMVNAIAHVRETSSHRLADGVASFFRVAAFQTNALIGTFSRRIVDVEAEAAKFRQQTAKASSSNTSSGRAEAVPWAMCAVLHDAQRSIARANFALYLPLAAGDFFGLAAVLDDRSCYWRNLTSRKLISRRINWTIPWAPSVSGIGVNDGMLIDLRLRPWYVSLQHRSGWTPLYVIAGQQRTSGINYGGPLLSTSPNSSSLAPVGVMSLVVSTDDLALHLAENSVTVNSRVVVTERSTGRVLATSFRATTVRNVTIDDSSVNASTLINGIAPSMAGDIILVNETSDPVVNCALQQLSAWETLFDWNGGGNALPASLTPATMQAASAWFLNNRLATETVLSSTVNMPLSTFGASVPWLTADSQVVVFVDAVRVRLPGGLDLILFVIIPQFDLDGNYAAATLSTSVMLVIAVVVCIALAVAAALGALMPLKHVADRIEHGWATIAALDEVMMGVHKKNPAVDARSNTATKQRQQQRWCCEEDPVENDAPHRYSFFREVFYIERRFARLLRQLRRIYSFLPQSVRQQLDFVRSHNRNRYVDASKINRGTKQMKARDAGSIATSTAWVDDEVNGEGDGYDWLMFTEGSKRHVSIVCVNLLRYAEVAACSDDIILESQRRYTGIVTAVLAAATSSGAIHSFHGDKAILSFNTQLCHACKVKSPEKYAVEALHVACMISNALVAWSTQDSGAEATAADWTFPRPRATSWGHSIGVATGVALVAPSGSADLQHVSIVGDVFPRAVRYERLCKLYMRGSQGVVDAASCWATHESEGVGAHDTERRRCVVLIDRSIATAAEAAGLPTAVVDVVSSIRSSGTAGAAPCPPLSAVFTVTCSALQKVKENARNRHFASLCDSETDEGRELALSDKAASDSKSPSPRGAVEEEQRDGSASPRNSRDDVFNPASDVAKSLSSPRGRDNGSKSRDDRGVSLSASVLSTSLASMSRDASTAALANCLFSGDEAAADAKRRCGRQLERIRSVLEPQLNGTVVDGWSSWLSLLTFRRIATIFEASYRGTLKRRDWAPGLGAMIDAAVAESHNDSVQADAAPSRTSNAATVIDVIVQQIHSDFCWAA